MRDQDGSVQRGRPPLWREARLGLEAARLLRDPILRGQGVRDGRGRPVLLIPGFLAGDGSLVADGDLAAPRRLPARAAPASSPTSTARPPRCGGSSRAWRSSSSATAGRRRSSARAAAAASRGARPAPPRPRARHRHARLAAAGHARDPPARAPAGRGHRRARPPRRARACSSAPASTASAATSFWADLAAPLPAGVGSVSIYSRSDGVVDWRACVDPAGRRQRRDRRLALRHGRQPRRLPRRRRRARGFEDSRASGAGRARRTRTRLRAA